MRGIESAGINPDNPAKKEFFERRNRILSQVNNMARRLVIFGVLGAAIAPGEVDPGFIFQSQTEVSQKKKLSFEEKKKKAEELFGWDSLEAKGTEVRNVKDFEKIMKGKTIIDGLVTSSSSEFEELNSDKFTEIVNKTFPKGWVNNEVAAISPGYVTEAVPPEYGLGKDSKALAFCISQWRGTDWEGRRLILLTTAAEQQDIHYLVEELITHELGHANDWSSDMEMSNEERLDLLLAVSDRLDAASRYDSSYVESIKNRNKRLERYFKAREYWAEICSAYFNDPDVLDVEDYILVDSVVKKSDPNFNCRKSSQERSQMIEKNIVRTPRNRGNKYAPRNLPRR